jgi:hypothetical protein
MAENWDNEAAGATVVSGLADQPEIKLFGRWSSSDVVVSDISLTVSPICYITDLLQNRLTTICTRHRTTSQ